MKKKWTFDYRLIFLLIILIGSHIPFPTYADINFPRPADFLQTFAMSKIQKQGSLNASACTPSSGFTQCIRYTYSGTNQTFTVPAGVTSINVTLWGAGGGGPSTSYWSASGGGGGGGYTKNTLTVTPGETLNITVGQGGLTESTVATFGRGGAGGSALELGSSGGGGSFIWRGTPFSGTLLLAAGGGGGGSSGSDATPPAGFGPGGGGGGISGTVGGGRTGGPGTATAGGSRISGTGCSPDALNGSLYTGGTGASTPISATGGEAGGGGGGGYYGGGGGPCQPPSSSIRNGGGGGGSGYAGSGGTITGGGSGAANGVGGSAAGTSDTQYVSGVAVGGGCSGSSCPGGNGMIVVQWVAMPTVTISTISIGDTGSFTFNGNNGIGSQTITTTTSGPVSGAVTTLTTASVSTTITETIPAHYKLTSIDCTGLGAGGTATTDQVNGTVILDVAATASGANIVCTFTNQKWANLTLAKTWGNGIINDAVTVSSSGFSNSATVSSTSTGNNTTTGSSIEVTPDEVGTITESFNTGSAVNYSSVLSCTGNSIPLSGNQLTIGSADTNILCTETNTRLPATISVSKSANPATGTTVVAGTSIDYTVQAVISAVPNSSDLVLTDTLSNNQTLGILPSGCTASGQTITCTVPANSAPGTYTFTYPATVNQDASGSVSNNVTPSGGDSPTCTGCSTTHPISLTNDSNINLTIASDLKNFSLPGTSITYSYTVTNTGNFMLHNVNLTTPNNNSANCPETTISPGQSILCTRQYTTTLNDVKNGSITETATVTAISNHLAADPTLNTLAPITNTSTASLVVAFDPTVIKNKTQELLNSFLTTRAQLILSNQPDRRRLINRLEAKSVCTGTPDVSFSPGMNNVNLNASASSSTLCLETRDLDFWFETHAGYYWQGDIFSRNQGTFSVSHIGADYLVTNTIAAGLMTEADLTGQKGNLSELNHASGKGWMAGPYISARVAPNMYLHTRAAWGKSNNHMTILDNYQNLFNTRRSLYNAELNGNWQYRNWQFSPTTGFTYYHESQYQFTNSVNVLIPGQRIALGQLNFGPEISYLYLSRTFRKINTHVSFEGIYNFDINDKQYQASNDSYNGLSGRIKLGSEIIFPSGLSLSPAIQYDGLGRNTFSAIQGQIQISIPLDNVTAPRRYA